MKNKCRHKIEGVCFLNKEKCQDFYEQQKMCNNYSESDCPDHPIGHIFVQCDEWSATCTCGKVED